MIPIVLLAGTFARAADCAPLDHTRLRELVDLAKAAVDRDDLVSFAETRRALLQDLPCLEGPLPVDVWARFLLDEAVVAFALGEGWEAPLATALSLDPDLPRGDLPQDLREWVPVFRPPVGSALAPGQFLLDGQPLTAVPELKGVHVAQRLEAGTWTTRVLRNAPFPTDWQAPPRASQPAPVPVARRGRGSPSLIATGVAVAAVGAGVGVGSWALRGTVEDPGTGEQLVLANVAGWGLAGVGVVLGGVGFALPAPDERVALHVQGRF